MNNKFDERAQSITRRGALKKFGVGLAGMALTCFGLVLSAGFTAAAPDPTTAASVITDPAGDAVFPYDLYDGPVPAYLDVIEASVSLNRGVFHFEIKMSSDIPVNADPGFTPSVNHLGPTVGILTDRKTASNFKFFGQTDVYYFNFLVGILYSPADSGVGLGLGWDGFLIDLSTFTVVEIPMKIRGDTLMCETSARSLGDPNSCDWAVGSECDPVPVTEEKHKSAVVVDFVPDHGFATWPAQEP